MSETTNSEDNKTHLETSVREAKENKGMSECDEVSSTVKKEIDLKENETLNEVEDDTMDKLENSSKKDSDIPVQTNKETSQESEHNAGDSEIIINNVDETDKENKVNEDDEVLQDENKEDPESEKNSSKESEEENETMFKKTLKSSGIINELERNCVAEPLLFPDNLNNNDSGVSEEECSEESIFTESEIPCVLCDFAEKNDSVKSQQDYLCHLVLAHNLVIADVKLIADLRKYAIHWKNRLQDRDLKDCCVIIQTNTFSKEHDADYSMLCDTLPEDREIREKLHLEKLRILLEQQTKERSDNEFKRMCLFCTKLFQGNRLSLFSHMNEDHNFNVGHPDNIVNVHSFLDEVEKRLNKNLCLFCEKSFRDRPALREHMRKKAHRRLNPKNKDYDKYYIINYLELGKTWETLHAENDTPDFNEDWTGWDEDSQNAVCFFCEESFATPESVYSHMESHGFDFGCLRKEMHLSFYQQIKMINYIRREVHKMNEMIDSKDDEGKPKTADEKAQFILDQIKTSTKWNQPQYYFPTYENDSLLCQLEDKEGLFEPEDTFVVGEDGIDCKMIINESVLTDLVVGGYFD